MNSHFGTVLSFLFLLLIKSALAESPTPASATPSASPAPSPTPTLHPYEHGSRNSKQVALTFDACSTKENKYEAKIIETLRLTQTPATLFLGGRWMEAHQDVVKSLANDPLFELATHSYNHPHMDKLTKEKLDRQFVLAQRTFKNLTGKKAQLFRPPFGDLNNEVILGAKKHKLLTVTWDLPSGDPDPKLSIKKLVKNTASQAKNGSIIVLHMNGNGVHTAKALPELIVKLKAKGLKFVTVGQMIREDAQLKAARK